MNNSPKQYAVDFVKLMTLVLSFIAIETFLSKGDFFFTYFGWVDHWLYLGQFDYPLELAHLENYKSSRLIWIWQNFFIFKYFKYPTNTYIIVVFSLLKFWTIFWLVMREYLTNKKQALLFVAIFIFYPTFRQNGGWYYHNFEALGWWLLAVYVVRTIQLKKIDSPYLLLAGVFAGFAINTNLYFINFLPVFLFLAPKLFYKQIKNIFYSCLGLVLSVVILGFFNLMIGANFTYFMPMLEMIQKFNGAPELWKPFWETDSIGFYSITLTLSVAFLYGELLRYKNNKKIHYYPLTISYLYTSIVYFFWHLRGVEVLAVNIHNSMLLVMGILMLLEVANSFEIQKYSNLKLIVFSLITCFLFHFMEPFFHYFTLFSIDRNNAVILSALVASLFFYIVFRFKNNFIFIISLMIMPAGLSTHGFYPERLKPQDTCLSRTEHDILFEMRNEMQKLSSPVILHKPDNSKFGKTLEFIGMHKQWPLFKYIEKECTYEGRGLDYYPYVAVISETAISLENLISPCKDFTKMTNVKFKKKFEACNGEEIYFTIFSMK